MCVVVDHEAQCGIRTEHCPQCGAFVKLNQREVRSAIALLLCFGSSYGKFCVCVCRSTRKLCTTTRGCPRRSWTLQRSGLPNNRAQTQTRALPRTHTKTQTGLTPTAK